MAEQGKQSEDTLTQLPEEIDSHFQMRLTVYQRAIKDGLDHERALQIANVFRNCYFMGCGYDPSVLSGSQKYWEEDLIKHYV